MSQRRLLQNSGGTAGCQLQPSGHQPSATLHQLAPSLLPSPPEGAHVIAGTASPWGSPWHLQAVPLQSCCHQATRHSRTRLQLLRGEGRVTLSYILKATFRLQKAAK